MRMLSKASLHLTLLLGLIATCTGCCYDCRWADAGKIPTPADSITGRWTGTWKSEESGHEGGLRCILTQTDAKHYHADFHATFFGIFSYSYDIDLTARATDSATQPSIVYFNGEADLGWLAGGKYTYTGKADPRNFFCSYRADKDYGTFQMVRPGGK
jgi:hypothetical protein